MSGSLHQYWIKFDDPQLGYLAEIGCGVTAPSLDDGLQMVLEHVLIPKYGRQTLPPRKLVLEDVDVYSLDVGHVLPNIASPERAGVWYPPLNSTQQDLAIETGLSGLWIQVLFETWMPLVALLSGTNVTVVLARYLEKRRSASNRDC